MVPPEDTSSSDSEGAEQLDPLDRQTRFVRQERDNSSDEDDIPMMELRKRLRTRRQDVAKGSKGQGTSEIGAFEVAAADASLPEPESSRLGAVNACSKL